MISMAATREFKILSSLSLLIKARHSVLLLSKGPDGNV